MNILPRIAGLALVTLFASTSLTSALDIREGAKMDDIFSGAPIDINDNTPIDLPPDNTPVDLPPDNTPIDLPPDNTPIDLPANPDDGLNDAVLDGIDDEGGTDTADATIILACVVDGADLILINKGDAIPPGTRVKWAANGDHGTVQLPNGLNPGQKARIENALDGDAAKCSAEAVL